MSNADIALAYFESKGLTKNQAAGIVGNLQQESGVNPSDAGGGIAQWGGSRYTALQAYAASTGQSPTALLTQLQFLWNELAGSYPGTLSALRETSTPGQAATLISEQYERPGIPMLANRIKYANQAAGSNGGSSLLSIITNAAGNAIGATVPAVGLGEILSGSSNPITGAVTTVKDALSWTTELAKFLSFLTSASGWDRVLKTVGGGLLVLLALNEIAKAGGASPAGAITTVAKVAAK